MSLYDDFYPVAVEMLEEFGADAVLIGSAPAASDFDKRAGRPAASYAVVLERPARAAVTRQTLTSPNGRQLVSSTAVMLVEPRQGDKLKMGETTWTVGTVSKDAPQGQAIVYYAEVS